MMICDKQWWYVITYIVYDTMIYRRLNTKLVTPAITHEPTSTYYELEPWEHICQWNWNQHNFIKLFNHESAIENWKKKTKQVFGKMPTLSSSGRYSKLYKTTDILQTTFLNWFSWLKICCVLYLILLKSVSKGPNNKKSALIDNDFVQDGRQAITWSNADQLLWRQVASLDQAPVPLNIDLTNSIEFKICWKFLSP